jgi:hypothetical protein
VQTGDGLPADRLGRFGAGDNQLATVFADDEVAGIVGCVMNIAEPFEHTGNFAAQLVGRERPQAGERWCRCRLDLFDFTLAQIIRSCAVKEEGRALAGHSCAGT